MRIKPLVSQLTLVAVNPISVLLPVQELTLVPALWVAQLARACVLAVLVQKALIHIVEVAARPFDHAFFLFVILVNPLEWVIVFEGLLTAFAVECVFVEWTDVLEFFGKELALLAFGHVVFHLSSVKWAVAHYVKA